MDRSRQLVSLAALAAVAVFLTAAPAVGQLGKTYKNTTWGFSFKPPKDWNAIPPDPLARDYKLVNFTADRAVSGFHPNLDVFYFRREATTGKKSRAILPSATPETMAALIDRAGLKPEADVRQRTINKITVEEQLFTRSAGVPLSVQTYLFHGDTQVAMVFTTLSSRYNKEKRGFESSARSFKWIDRDAPTARDDSLSDQERHLDEQIKALPPGWDYEWSHKKRYLILYDADKGFVRKLQHHLEAMRDYYEQVFPLQQPITEVSICRVCSDRDTYHAYGGPPSTGGYWYSAAGELVVFVDKDRNRNAVFSVVSHEAFHQYIYYFYGELAPHSWYNEGHGDYFGGARLSASGKKVMAIDPLTVSGFDRYSIIKTAVQKDLQTPLKDFLNWTQAQYYNREVIDPGTGYQRVSVAYAQGWSLIYFLRNGRQEGAKVKEEWTAMLERYLGHLVAARDALLEKKGEGKNLTAEEKENIRTVAYNTTFADWTDADWQELEDAWLRFYR